MESSRDSGCRQELGRFVQFWACRKPTIAICRVILVLLVRRPPVSALSLRMTAYTRGECGLSAPDDALGEIELFGDLVFAGKRTQFLESRVLDLDAVAPPLRFAHGFDLTRIEHPARAFGRRCRLQVARELRDLLLELLQRAEGGDVEHRHEA